VSTSTEAKSLDVDDHGHVLVKLSDIPSEQWKEAFREYWGTADTVGSTAVRKEAFSHFSETTIVFRGVDVDGFVEHCKDFTVDAVKYANELTQRLEDERDARIRGQAKPTGPNQDHIEAERAKARKVRFV
jgi:hypothetical protein